MLLLQKLIKFWVRPYENKIKNSKYYYCKSIAFLKVFFKNTKISNCIHFFNPLIDSSGITEYLLCSKHIILGILSFFKTCCPGLARWEILNSSLRIQSQLKLFLLPFKQKQFWWYKIEKYNLYVPSWKYIIFSTKLIIGNTWFSYNL